MMECAVAKEEGDSDDVPDPDMDPKLLPAFVVNLTVQRCVAHWLEVGGY